MSAAKRLTSLDAFRGFTIAAMVLVNNPGDWSHLYSQLAHAHWHGWTFTDWIFPFFLFIGGVSMSLSLGRLAAAGADKPALLTKLATRAVMIFLIGLTLNLFPDFNFSNVRIPGVLQRIALCTLLAAPLVVYCGWRAQLAAIGVLLALYSVLMLLVPVPGIGAGVLEPGRDMGAYLDRMLLGGHLWKQSVIWDPEGLLSTMPALCTQLIGVLTGRWLSSSRPRVEQTVWLLLSGLALLWAGAMLDVVLMPINKALWTPSFVLFTGGWALLLFGVFYWLLDANPHRRWRAIATHWSTPLLIYGMNALFIFAFSSLIAKMLMPYGPVVSAMLATLDVAPELRSLLYALLFDAAMFMVAWVMWRKKWFVKV
ncbi:acyltransferase family protein [Massilia sp. CF038]|uniref:acyltransferase family protein n=1 Tax=Massilia sp. CF038 TaxID=1881045 RepID=UPI000912E8B7|nr:heparan-alpha-glucosaminide N-acetyltransferase domain-containing protein [Massilia sp. CF038]SHH46934.1 Predicted acyltransferase [Massilia sp. CF038]